MCAYRAGASLRLFLVPVLSCGAFICEGSLILCQRTWPGLLTGRAPGVVRGKRRSLFSIGPPRSECALFWRFPDRSFSLSAPRSVCDGATSGIFPLLRFPAPRRQSGTRPGPRGFWPRRAFSSQPFPAVRSHAGAPRRQRGLDPGTVSDCCIPIQFAAHLA